MIDVEPSWEILGDIVADGIIESNLPNWQKAELTKIVLQMATITHHARAHQLRQKFRDGEINDLPAWAKLDSKDFDPFCPKCKRLIDGCYGGCLSCDLEDDD